MEKRLKIIGIISIMLGSLAALFCVIPFPGVVFFAILAGFLGMVCSSIYVYIDTKHEVNTKRLTPGIIGMILSSFPIIFMLAIIIMSKLR